MNQAGRRHYSFIELLTSFILIYELTSGILRFRELPTKIPEHKIKLLVLVRYTLHWYFQKYCFQSSPAVIIVKTNQFSFWNEGRDSNNILTNCRPRLWSLFYYDIINMVQYLIHWTEELTFHNKRAYLQLYRLLRVLLLLLLLYFKS